MAVEDRPYILGDTLEATIVLRARGNAVVREARIELVYGETLIETFTAMVPERGTQKAEHGVSPVGTYQPLPPPSMVPKQVTELYKCSSVYGKVVFLKDRRFDRGEAGTLEVPLTIPSEAPLNALRGAAIKWTLVTTVDLAWARNLKRRLGINVLLV